MSLLRKQIRNQAVELVKGATAAEDKVYASRIVPNHIDTLPVINVYTPSDTPTVHSDAPLVHKRDMQLVFEIITKNSVQDGLATDVGDDIAEQIENIMGAADADTKNSLGCLVNGISLISSTTEYESNGDSTVNHTRLAFAVVYYKQATTDTLGSQAEALEIKADWDIGTASDPDPEATDNINLRP
jgi:hypothetical protein